MARVAAARWHMDERYITVLVRADELWHGTLGEYLRAVVPSEMPALWPMEALKAQAVACRSYAAWRLANRRSEHIHIHGDDSDQIFNEARIHPRTDAAIAETADVVLKRPRSAPPSGGEAEWEVFPARYVSRCGRVDCVYCRGQGGHQGRRWARRMCQYGARHLAEAGLTWRQILGAYYAGVSIVESGGHPADGASSERGGGPEGADEAQTHTGDAASQRQTDQDTGTAPTRDGTESEARPYSEGDAVPMEWYKDPATDAFAVDGQGRVVGCRVDVWPAERNFELQPGHKVYRVVDLRFVNEEQARGDTRILVQVLDRDGRPTMAKVVCAWPQQRAPRWDGTAYDWASPAHWAEFAQGSGNYDPAKHGPLGPYVVFVQDDKPAVGVASDWCVGFGLPGNRHVGYQVTFRESVAGGGDTPPNPPDTGGREPGCNLILAAIAKLLGRG